jgi:hypothetical protein
VVKEAEADLSPADGPRRGWSPSLGLAGSGRHRLALAAAGSRPFQMAGLLRFSQEADGYGQARWRDH